MRQIPARSWPRPTLTANRINRLFGALGASLTDHITLSLAKTMNIIISAQISSWSISDHILLDLFFVMKRSPCQHFICSQHLSASFLSISPDHCTGSFFTLVHTFTFA